MHSYAVGFIKTDSIVSCYIGGCYNSYIPHLPKSTIKDTYGSLPTYIRVLSSKTYGSVTFVGETFPVESGVSQGFSEIFVQFELAICY